MMLLALMRAMSQLMDMYSNKRHKAFSNCEARQATINEAK